VFALAAASAAGTSVTDGIRGLNNTEALAGHIINCTLRLNFELLLLLLLLLPKRLMILFHAPHSLAYIY